jgi:hypothetical protein
LSGPARRKRVSRAPVILTALTLLVLGRCCLGQFVTWDDEFVIYANPAIVHPNAAGLRKIWTHPDPQLYIPVVYTVWWYISIAESSLSQNSSLRPMPYHVANLLVHLASVLIVWRILQWVVTAAGRGNGDSGDASVKDRGLSWPALAGAALFAIHPLQVEPVAWATGMKDLLGGLLALASVAMYLAGRQDTRPRRARRRMGWAMALYLVAILAKPSAVVTPLIAGVLDWLISRRSARSVAGRLAICLVPALACVIVTTILRPSMAMVYVRIADRPRVASDALTFYLEKLIWPAHLGMDYGRIPARVLANPWTRLAWIIPAALALVIWRLRRRDFVAAGLITLAALLPVLGLIPFGFQWTSTVADRYFYLAMLGPAVALASALASVRAPAWPAVAVTLVVLVAAGMKAFVQVGVWHDNYTMYEHALEVNPHSWVASKNLAVVLDRAGRSADAMNYYVLHLDMDPASDEPYENLVMALPRAQVQRPDENPRWAALHERVADHDLANGRRARAIEQLREAAALLPADSAGSPTTRKLHEWESDSSPPALPAPSSQSIK